MVYFALTIYCDDKPTLNRLKALKIKSIHQEKNKRYVENVLDVIKKIHEMDASIQITNLGELDFIIDYQKPKPPMWVWAWVKTMFVAVICFWGRRRKTIRFWSCPIPPAWLLGLFCSLTISAPGS